MKIKILFDSEALDKSFSTGWGVSYLIDDILLFDTGSDARILLKNMKRMGVKISDIRTIVISHDHWDHRGGLWAILKENSHIKVYMCPGFSKRFKRRVQGAGSEIMEANEFNQIEDNIYLTGEIPGKFLWATIAEQALILKTPRGLTVLTGCAHPGVIPIIKKVKRCLPDSIYLVAGGFHLIGKRSKTVKEVGTRFRELGVEKIAPAHCTGKTAKKLLREEYGPCFIESKVGQIIEV